MLDNIKKFFEFASKNGLYLPAAYDSIEGKASSSLFFSHLAFYMAFITIICLSVKDIGQGTIASMLFAIMYLVFYLLRKLSKAKFNLKDKSIDLESDTSNNTEKEQK